MMALLAFLCLVTLIVSLMGLAHLFTTVRKLNKIADDAVQGYESWGKR